MKVRIATVDDAPAIGHVHTESWRQAYRGLVPAPVLAALSAEKSAARWRSRLEAQEHPVLVLDVDHAVQGFSAFGQPRDADLDDPSICELYAIYSLAASWRSGGGSALLAASRERCALSGHRTMVLWVLATNTRARRFYEARGFVPDGSSKRDEIAPNVELLEDRYRGEVAWTARA